MIINFGIKSKRRLKNEIEKEYNKIFDGFCYNNTDKLLFIKKSNIKNAGNGVFTLQNIKKGEEIGIYDGTRKKAHKTQTDFGDYSFSLSNVYYIDSSSFPRSIIAMVNDATHDKKYKNNCEFILEKYDKKGKKLKECKRNIVLYSTKEIKRGEELFASYGDDYWSCREFS